MAIAFAGGAVLGVIFFGGLYFSVDKLTSVKYPALMMLGSTVLRMAILLGGVYLLMSGEVKNAAAALVGIVLAKFVMIYLVRKKRLGRTVKE